MSTPYPGDDAHGEEEDPTGVRSLLSSLPDPGPMPEDLVARITLSLEQEQERREFQEQLPGDPVTSTPDVISLAAERNARRPGRTLLWLGSAAAAAVAVTVAVSQLFGGGAANDSAAQLPNSSQAQTGSGADRPAPGGQQDGPDSAPGAQGEDGAADTTTVTVSPTTATLTSDDLQPELVAWVRGGASTSTATAGAQAEEGLSTEQAQRCLARIPDLDGTAFQVGTGTLDGTVPIVAVVQTAPEPVHGWVLSADCADGAGEVLLPRQRQG